MSFIEMLSKSNRDLEISQKIQISFQLTLFKFRSSFNLFQIKRIIQYRLASIDSNAWRHLCAQLYNNFKFYSGDNYKKFFFLHFCSISSPHTRTIENECV